VFEQYIKLFDHNNNNDLLSSTSSLLQINASGTNTLRSQLNKIELLIMPTMCHAVNKLYAVKRDFLDGSGDADTGFRHSGESRRPAVLHNTLAEKKLCSRYGRGDCHLPAG